MMEMKCELECENDASSQEGSTNESPTKTQIRLRAVFYSRFCQKRMPITRANPYEIYWHVAYKAGKNIYIYIREHTNVYTCIYMYINIKR